MPERPDLRRIATDIREALGSYPPEALVDILTYVFQAYVVEGAPTVHAPPIERIADLEGMGFADLIHTLQLRLDIPELSLFEVANGRVSVRVGGELVALLLQQPEHQPAPHVVMLSMYDNPEYVQKALQVGARLRAERGGRYPDDVDRRLADSAHQRHGHASKLSWPGNRFPPCPGLD